MHFFVYLLSTSQIIMNKRLFNITLLFITAYITVHLIYLSIVYLAALSVDMPNVQYYFTTIYFDYKEYYQEWTRFKVVMMYGLPSLMMLVLSFLYFVLYFKLDKGDTKLKHFLLWLIIISVSFFIADLITAPYFKRTLSVVFDWYYFKRESVFAFSLIVLPVIPLIAYYAYKPFIQIANSRTYLKTKFSRLSFLTSNVILGFLIGMLIISMSLIAVPSYEMRHYFQHDFVRFSVIFFVLIFVLFFSYSKQYIQLSRDNSFEKIEVSHAVSLIVILTILYLTLTLV